MRRELKPAVIGDPALPIPKGGFKLRLHALKKLPALILRKLRDVVRKELAYQVGKPLPASLQRLSLIHI